METKVLVNYLESHGIDSVYSHEMAQKIEKANKKIYNAVIDYIEKGDIPTLIPDLATGGFIIDDPKQFLLINETGKGTFKIRAKYEVDGQYILIKEIPFTTTREEIIDKIKKGL